MFKQYIKQMMLYPETFNNAKDTIITKDSKNHSYHCKKNGEQRQPELNSRTGMSAYTLIEKQNQWNILAVPWTIFAKAKNC